MLTFELYNFPRNNYTQCVDSSITKFENKFSPYLDAKYISNIAINNTTISNQRKK